MESVEQLAGRLYEAYCRAVGGRGFNGDLLPSWEHFLADSTKERQSEGWLAVAREVLKTNDL